MSPAIRILQISYNGKKLSTGTVLSDNHMDCRIFGFSIECRKKIKWTGVLNMENNNENSNISTNQDAVPHKRRAHYSGKYPRRFEEKYKEQNPEKYQDEIEHIIGKGNTPAGMHIPIMVAEVLDALKIQPGDIGLDCTLGYGGHSTRILETLLGKNHVEDNSSFDAGDMMKSSNTETDSVSNRTNYGHLYSIDYDPIEIEKTTKRLRDRGFDEAIWTPIHDNFRNIDKISAEYGHFDFVMADLGVSSMQIDNPERGFTWKADGPLDLRFNPEQGESAAEHLSHLSEDDIEHILTENSDEPYAKDIAKAIHHVYWRGGSIETTAALRSIVEKALLEDSKTFKKLPAKEQEETLKKSLARVFQALRIEVNQELTVLDEFLEKLPGILKPGARVAILTFHSGEDRLVKKSFKTLEKSGVYSAVARDVIRPTKEECYRNPRAHSTKLRWAVRTSSL